VFERATQLPIVERNLPWLHILATLEHLEENKITYRFVSPFPTISYLKPKAPITPIKHLQVPVQGFLRLIATNETDIALDGQHPRSGHRAKPRSTGR